MNLVSISRSAKFAASRIGRDSRLRAAPSSARAGGDGRRGCARQPAGLHRQCRRPRVLRYQFLGAIPTGAGDARQAGEWLNQYNRYAFLIEGHADERGTREYNIALGARRAQTVREYLVSRGVSAQRMRTISYGKERPVAVCNDISCWSQNRRAVTVLNQSS